MLKPPPKSRRRILPALRTPGTFTSCFYPYFLSISKGTFDFYTSCDPLFCSEFLHLEHISTTLYFYFWLAVVEYPAYSTSHQAKLKKKKKTFSPSKNVKIGNHLSALQFDSNFKTL